MKITLSQLRAKGACEEQLNKFKEFFGSEVDITLDLCLTHAKYFAVGWVVRNFLSFAARDSYLKSIALAGDSFRKVFIPVGSASDEDIASAWKVYNETWATAFYNATQI